MKFEILFEDHSIIALVKPSLIHSVSSSGSSEPSIADYLGEYFPEMRGVSGNRHESGLIHRLDFETSGVLVAARSKESWNFLRQEFRAKKIQKRYLALVEGVPQEGTIISGYIGSRYRGSKKASFSKHESPRFVYSETSIEKIVDRSPSGKMSILKFLTSTGARHQIRIHAKELGHPLVWDSLYGSSIEGEPLCEHKKHFLLHASEMIFRHPSTLEAITLEAPLPRTFKAIAGWHN